MKGTLRALFALIVTTGVAAAQSNVLRIDVEATRSRDSVAGTVDEAVLKFARRTEALTGGYRATRLRNLGMEGAAVLLPPVRVEIRPSGTRSVAQGGDLVLVFDNTGERAFPESYRVFLETVFTNAKATMNLVFGAPALGGEVRVANYDADIGDRDAVAGGYYLPDNGSGEREIRFPVYQNPETAAVNFIHTLLLAYQGNKTYAFDAFQEGLVRAATMKIARTPAAMPGLDRDQIEATLASTYEIGPWYDWNNQPSLAARQFIAPNLRNLPLPAGGSIGGLYLLRFMMAGSAWEKVLIEYPNFIREFNERFYQQPTLRNNVPGLVALGQNVLNALRPANPQVEGRTFADWYRHQYVLDTHLTRGLKLHVSPQPIVFGLGGADFGVFDFQTTFFSTEEGGREQLLTGTSYPIFWNSTFDRLFPSAQDERIDIVASYGSVTPNFPDENAGIPYRVAADIPVLDELVRVHVPAGAVATATKPTPNDLYGTVEGIFPAVGVSYLVRALVGGNVLGTAPVTDGAFGVRIGTALWRSAQPVLLEVQRTSGTTTTTVYSRRVNKAPGSLAVDLRIGGEATVQISLLKGINMTGFPVDPFSQWNPDVMNLAASETLAARWNPSIGKYNLFPDLEPFQIGHGYFVRVPSNRTLGVDGYVAPPNTPWSVSLKPGWNLVASPLRSSISTDRVLVVKGTGFPVTFAEAEGVELGTDFFHFVRGGNDPVSGAPETGSYSPASQFEPSRGYFVRCLAPEGATLTFFPTDAPPTQARASAAPAGHAWRLRVQATGGGRSTQSVLAMSATATGGFDPAEDSPLPPGIGGFQIGSQVNASRYFRDVRRTSAGDTYTVVLDGLAVGAAYTVTLTEEKARARQVSVSRDGGRAVGFTGVGRITFVAESPSTTMTVKVVR
ncbi:MAG TPA: hypothetical protein VGE01_00090 [Fimbriimonas sp.]